MKKCILKTVANAVCFSLLGSIQAIAGGLLTNTNQNLAFDRNFARDATMEIDGALANPAGLAWLGEGWHLSINWQTSLQTRTVESTFLPFKQNVEKPADANGTKRFKGETIQPLIPSVQAAWQKGDWTISGNAAYIAGGGKCTYYDGLPSFESQVAMIPQMLSAAGMESHSYGVDGYMYGRQYDYSLQGGVTWRAINREENNDNLRRGLSFYAGMRLNYISNKYRAHVRDISADLNGTMTKLSPFFQKQASKFHDAAAQARSQGDESLASKYEAQAKTMTVYEMQTKDKELECSQSGWGVTPIVGVDYRMGKLNLGLRYELNTHLTVKNKTKVNTSGLSAYDDGVKMPNDIPSLLTIGAQYDILPAWRVMAGWHHFFDKSASMANHKEDLLSHNSNEFTMGTEVKVSKRVTLSCGGQLTNYGLTDKYQSDMSFACNSCSVGCGTKISLSDRLDLNVAYFWTHYDDYEKSFTDYNGIQGVKGKDVYSRKNNIFGVGINMRL